MKIRHPFRRLDRRITSELAKQRTLIVKGLVCVVLGSLLTGATLFLTYTALEAIGQARPVAVDVRRLQSDEAARELSQRLGVPQTEISEAIQEIERSGSEDEGLREARQQEALRRLALVCLAVVLVFGLKYIFTRGQMVYLAKAANRLASDVRLRIFDKLMRMPVAYFNSRRTGEIQSIVTNDVNVYQTSVMVVRDSIEGPIKAVVALGAVFIIQWRLGLIALLFVPILAAIVTSMGRRIKSAQAQIQDDLAAVTAMSQEALSGTRVVKAFSAEDHIRSVYGSLVERQLNSQNLGARRIATLRPVVEFMGALAIAIILYVCGLLATNNWLTLAQIIVVVQALDQVNQGFKAITNVSSTYNQVQAAVDRIHTQILDVEEESFRTTQGTVLDNPIGRIAFENVTFTYPDGASALRNVSFVLEPGQSLALVGPSGSGKSTIADLVLRFYDPSDGRITFDGHDYRDLDLAWLRRQFGVVPQQTFLFAGTVADNLRLGAPEATEDQVAEAVRLAHAERFIGETAEGLQTILGERGTRLSGGELQRLSIARALVTDPRVLVLDEATSNLDAESERAVTEALDEVMATRTSLFIAHRLTTAARADTIVVMRKGEIIETGSHEELVSQNGVYAGMLRTFAGGAFDHVADLS